jgi:predicted nucleotide-binding protein
VSYSGYPFRDKALLLDCSPHVTQVGGHAKPSGAHIPRMLESPAMATVDQAISSLSQLLDEAKALRENYRDPIFKEQLELWSKRVAATLREWGLPEEVDRFWRASADKATAYDRQMYYYYLMEAREIVIAALREDLTKHPDFYTEKPNPVQSQPHRTLPEQPTKVDKVFLGHGRSLLWTKVERWLEKDKGLAVAAWETESHAGEQVVQVLEGLLDSSTFAVLVVTAEDATTTGTLRARQNVVHEVGLFQGKLGFKKVALLQQEGIESFSNIDGLQTIRFSEQRIEAAFPELERMMKREGLVK